MGERLMGLYQAACASFITCAWRMGENAGLYHTSWGFGCLCQIIANLEHIQPQAHH